MFDKTRKVIAGELDRLRGLFSTGHRDEELRQRLELLRKKTPVPVFWLFGKTQSGKTSTIRLLTGAADAEIGQGFRPCTRFSREYPFPGPEAPLLNFLDTRGVDEPGYDPAEDIARFGDQAHVMIVTVKVLDHALKNVVAHLRQVRQNKPHRPVILALTCLHEAYPGQQHPQPYPFEVGGLKLGIPESVPEALRRTLTEQLERFEGLSDVQVPVDLTQLQEGYDDPNYGGVHLKSAILNALPAVYRQTLITLDQSTHELKDLYAQAALPHILGYCSLAATAAAIPVPWVDIVALAGIQTRMIYHLADFYGQPLTAQRFGELASTLGLGMLARQATREVLKLVPGFGSVLSAVSAAAATFALGKAFCFYYSAVKQGHVPNPEELKRYYAEQLSLAEQLWKRRKENEPVPSAGL
jgi:uncharacterized protein (DUF697 family)/predicted GTPase